VLGGQGTQGRVGTIERATLAADGTLQPFTTSSVGMPVAEEGHATVTIGSSIYVIGGNPQGSFTGNASRTIVNTDGTLQAFTSAPSLVTARASSYPAVIGPYLYVIGGANSRVLGTVERATINSDGSLGTFATVSGVTTATPRFDGCTVVIGQSLYLIAGFDGTNPIAANERATINADDTITTFSTTGVPSLVTPRNGAWCAVVGSTLWVAGGDSGSTVDTVERATINSDGSLGSFATVANFTLVNTLTHPTGAVVGNAAYVVGGGNGSGPVNNVSGGALQ
jgi:hypothetical protein